MNHEEEAKRLFAKDRSFAQTPQAASLKRTIPQAPPPFPAFYADVGKVRMAIAPADLDLPVDALLKIAQIRYPAITTIQRVCNLPFNRAARILKGLKDQNLIIKTGAQYEWTINARQLQSGQNTDILASVKTRERIKEISTEKVLKIPEGIQWIKNIVHWASCPEGSYGRSYIVIDLVFSQDGKYYIRCSEAKVSSESNGRPCFTAKESFCALKCEPNAIRTENLKVESKWLSVFELFDAAQLEDVCEDIGLEYMENKVFWASETAIMSKAVAEAYERRFGKEEMEAAP